MAPITRTQKRKADNEHQPSAESSSSSPRRAPRRDPHCPANGPLLQALHDLSEAMLRARSVDAKNRFKSVALRRAALALAELDYVVGEAAPLAAGPHKVPGVGRGTAAYIDEFLETGNIHDIAKYNELAEEAATRSKQSLRSEQKEQSPVDITDTTTTTTTATKVGKVDASASSAQNDSGTVIQINRAPVLTLWVTVVAEQEGFARDEALTYGRWVSGTLARSKGQSLGLFPHDPKAAQKRRETEDSVHVIAFGRMKIPIVLMHGKRLALQRLKPVDPLDVQDYLERSFGDQLEEAQAAMRGLARSMSPEELKKRCYHLYEEFRPEWTGWGQKSSLHITKIWNLSKNEE